MDHAHDEKRRFPRIPVDCPVLFKTPDQNLWSLASILDFSAAGFSMTCDAYQHLEMKIKFELHCSTKRVIPNLTGVAKIVRCDLTEQGSYAISCKILSIQQTPAK